MVSPAEAGGSSGRAGNEPLSAVLAKDSRLAHELKSKLSVIGSSRSSLIRQLREISPQFKFVLVKVRELRAARDTHTAVVKELKAKRQEANDAVRAIGPDVREALDAKEAAVEGLAKTKIRGRKSASQLYSEMEALEMKIITEAMPFSREQEIMKVVKEKRKQLEAVKAFSEAASSHRELFSKFSELRRQSYAFHSELRQHAAESQKLHEEMIKLIPKLKELRQRKKSLLEQLGRVKEEYAASNFSLGRTLSELSGVREKIDLAAAEKRKREIEEKEAQLTDKLKSGKKLTARDLMMLRQ